MSSAIALLLVLASSAGAQVDAETQANLDRATVYWNAAPNCPGGVAVIHDNAFVAPDAAKAAVNGCSIWVSDWYLSTSPIRRCGTIVHEYGHLLGHMHDPGLVDDPLGVMISDAMPVSCLDAVSAEQVVYNKWSERRIAREDCAVRANERPHRALRVKARLACTRRYGHIGRRPPL